MIDSVILPVGYRRPKRVKALSADQAHRLMAELKKIIVDRSVCAPGSLAEENKRYALACLVALGTGMRIGEVCAQRYDRNFDPETNTLSVTSQIVRRRDKTTGRWERIEVDPKTEAAIRSIPIEDGLAEVYKTYAPKTGFLLPPPTFSLNVKNSVLPNPELLRGWFNTHLLTHDYPVITFHNLRHTYATILLANGADYKTLAELLGHSKVETTMGIYAQTNEAMKRDAVAKVKW